MHARLRPIYYMCVGVVALLLAACDVKDDDERYIPSNAVRNKAVLIEDFTGQNCSNCPLAADVITNLQTLFGADTIISVAIHGGSLALNEETSPYGLANAQGYDYHTRWGVEAWPSGMVDRTGGLLEYSQWTSAAMKRMRETPKVSIDLSNLTFDTTTDSLTLTPRVTAAEDVDGKLQVWLTESHIAGYQRMPSGISNRSYEHNHVFRASVNAPYGEQMVVPANHTVAPTYGYKLKSTWKAENLSVVVFFFNETDGVMQVTERKITGE